MFCKICQANPLQMRSITLYLILGSRSNSVEVQKSTIVTGDARLWQIDSEEIGKRGKS